MGGFIFNETGINGLYVIESRIFGDDRGYFMESYNAKDFKEAGIDVSFVQDNQSKSRKGVLRGLHFQINHPQGKLVRVISGEVFDVAVDLRSDSPTYKKWYGVILSNENKKQFFIPEGFAHGFQALDDGAVVSYLVTEHFNAEADRGLNPLDPSLVIKWPLEVKHMSPKDSGKPYIFMGIQL